MRTFTIIASIAFFFAPTVRAENWNQFRGPAGNGISSEAKAPLTWSATKNIKWKAPLPEPGNSSPIVWGERVFLTQATQKGTNRALLCFDRATGKERWSRAVAFNGEEPTHQTNDFAPATPATDGERIVVWYSSAGLHCYDLDGKVLWTRDLGPFIHIWGYGGSPVIHGDAVYLNCGPGARTFLVAIDKRTGNILWQADEPAGDSGLVKKNPEDKNPPWIGSWSTPLIATVDGMTQVLVSYPHHVKAYDPSSGKVLWQCGGLGDLVYTSVVAGDQLGIAMSGFHGPAIGFRLGGSGDVTATNRLWRHDKSNPQRIGSGVILGKNLFMVNEPGIAQCIDIETGHERWRARLQGGNVWGSIIAAAGRLYVTNQKGTTLVLAPNPDKFEVLAENSIEEPCNATLAISDGQFFLRTFKHIYCIDEN